MRVVTARPTLYLAVLSAALLVAATAVAYQPASNRPHVTTDQWGRCYAKSVPEAREGVAGTTRVYEVGRADDRLLVEYDWFARDLFLQCNVVSRAGGTGPSVVVVDRSSDPRAANADTVALAFYFGKERKKTYTYAELHGAKGEKQTRYPRIEAIPGYRYPGDGVHAFDVKTADGKVHTFDPTTGLRSANGEK